jgi:phage shock protein PspC (stress-responsive transcriptional regulator)
MKLTTTQEALVNRYLRDVALHLDGTISPTAREEGLNRLQRRIERELYGLGKQTLDDGDVHTVLDKLGPSSQHAAQMAPKKSLAGGMGDQQRIWLGVCANIADLTGAERWAVRTGAVVAGVLTGPLALLAYIGFYLHMYYRGSYSMPRIDTFRVVLRAIATIVIAFLLHAGTTWILAMIHYLHEQAAKRPVPEVGEWGWITNRMDDYLFFALVTAVPFAVLSALPVAKGWDYSLKRVSQAILALYGIMLAFGVASFVVGILLDFVNQFAQP